MALYLVAGLTGLHGVLTAKSALRYYRGIRFNRLNLLIELICAGLLVLACFVMLTHVILNVTPLLTFVCGWLLAAIATLPLLVTGIMKVVTAVRRKQGAWQNSLKLALHLLALLVYLTLVAWMSMLLALALTGEPYMGN